MPPSLSVCFFVASGSEANDLALRLARAKTNRASIICLDHGYHGHTQSLIEVSPYKFSGAGGEGPPPHVHVVPCPDVYRGPYKRDDALAGRKYAECGPIKLINEGLQPCAFIAESFPCVAGQIELPDGYLSACYSGVRNAGGLCIADEVQTGFGRLGSAFWGFEAQGVVPDIVTLGKPIGNGFPMGAVVTTHEIAAAFDNGMEFFCTGGGGPAAAAAGRAVLSVLRDANLPANAEKIGCYMKSKLDQLALRHALIGDVRGRGLFLGLELVLDRESLQVALFCHIFLLPHCHVIFSPLQIRLHTS
jgi:4-aminobutyrate aminotransferase-like enzyme